MASIDKESRTQDISRSAGSELLAVGEQLFLLFEGRRPYASSSRHLLAGLDAVNIGRGHARHVERAREGSLHQLTLRIADPAISSSHARLLRSQGRWVIEDAGSRNGTLLNGAKLGRAFLADGDRIEVGHTFFLYREAAVVAEDRLDLDATFLAPAAPGLATFVAALHRQIVALTQVATSPVPVVLQGESGTGKEMIARAVHRLSRRPGEFVAVNCGAIPASLVESELFGYREGAFSGATEDRPGHLRSASTGTLFLDEIGDLPLAAQAALLRALQEREVLPVGDSRAVPIDLRVVIATHHDLPALVASHRFRHDLYSRLSGYAMRLPPLRDRREDFGLLVGAILRRMALPEPGKLSFHPTAVRALLMYDWPLQVRELENVLAVAVALAGGRRIQRSHLPEVFQELDPTSLAPDARSAELGAAEVRLREDLVAALTEHAGNVSAVARHMGKGRTQIHRWLRRFGLGIDSFRRS